MPMLIVGVLLLLAKVADVGPVGGWSWWIILAPFAIAAVWWQFADSIGLTQRRAMDKMDRRKAARREKALATLGMDARGRRRHSAPGVRPPDASARPPAGTADPTQKDDAFTPSRRDRGS